MVLKEDTADIGTPGGPMRVHRIQPAAGGPFPAIILFSEIYQVTGPILRTARRLAAHGYLVAAPEVYHEFEPAGCALAYDKDGTDKGNRYKTEKELAAYDADAKAAIAHLLSHPACNGKLGSMGICLGGHLSFRCSMNPEILAGVCLYATDIHKRSLGKGMRDDSLDRIPEIRGEMLMVWGRQDPHVPQDGRDLIYRTLNAAGIAFTWHEFNAQHAFIRDEGPRYDAALADICYALALELFDRRLKAGNLETTAPAAARPGPLKLG
jgi:carboxymethylenebutenolidase